MKSCSKSAVTLLNIGACFFGAVILLYLAAPLLGGIFSLSAVIYYSSFIGIIFVAKYFLRKYEKNIVVTKNELLFKITYESVCYFLWFDEIVALIVLLFGLIINIIGYRAYLNKLNKEGKGDRSKAPVKASRE